MTLGLVGRKVGMTRVFDEQGVSVPVTVLDMSANRVTQVKSKILTAIPPFKLPLVRKSQSCQQSRSRTLCKSRC